MPDIKIVLNEEIRRLAKKEIKIALAPLQKTIADQRQTISELKKRIAQLEKAAPAPAEAPAAAAAEEDKQPKLRLNAAGINRIRTKLKLTQSEFAKLLNVSVHTVSMWELGNVSPRRNARAAICALRTIGKRELKRKLAEQAEPNANA
ncbi:MAG: helix-turn-helix domain-containing protein [Lentisphaeria bacterium]|nr:helix-turn-helix domain-containing protein [Lentisphaeria bacterium]